MTSKKKSFYGLLPLLLLLTFASEKIQLDSENVKFDYEIDEHSNGSIEVCNVITNCTNVKFDNDSDNDNNVQSNRSSPKKQQVLDLMTPKTIVDTSFDSGNQDDTKERRLQSEQAYDTSESVKRAEKLLRSFTTTSQLVFEEKKNEKKTSKKKCNALLGKFPLVVYFSTMPKELVKVVRDTLLGAGNTVDDLPKFYVDTYLSIFVTTNWEGMPQKAAYKITEFCKKDIYYKLKVLSAAVLITTVFGSFYLFAWKHIQEYFLQLGNPINEKDYSELLQSFLLTTFILILKVPITAIMPLLAGPFGVLISIMFPVSAVFVATFFSGIGLGFWYLVKKITGVDVIGWIGDNTACGPLEFMFGAQWHGMSQEKFNETKQEYLEKKGNKKKNMNEFHEFIARPVTCAKNDDVSTKSEKMAKLSQTMIFMRVLFPGIGDSLLNTYAMRYNIGFPELFISLWLGLPENAFTSYALQIVKHPWISALLVIFLGGLSTTTWIGKYALRHIQQGKSMCGKEIATEALTEEDDDGNVTIKNKEYHECRYDLFKKLSNLLIYIVLFVLTFFGRDIFPFDVFELSAYYTNQVAGNCHTGEYAGENLGPGEACMPTKQVNRNMKMAWGVGFMGVITLLTLAQLVRNNIPFLKSRNYGTGDFDNKETFAYKKEKALLEGTETKLNDKFENLKNYFDLEKDNPQKPKNYAKKLAKRENSARKLIRANQSAKEDVATKFEYEKNDERKELFKEGLKKLQKNESNYEMLEKKIIEEKGGIQENKI